MPYIISTINECSCCEERKPGLPGAGGAAHLCGDCSDSDGRTAVATLDEARLVAGGIWQKHLGYRKYGPTEDDLKRYGDWAVPESGGTVGPLPDGTVIEVRPIAFSSLGGMVGLRASDLSTDGEIIAAFNAA